MLTSSPSSSIVGRMRFALGMCLFLVSSVGMAQSGEIYEYKTKDGRPAFTNQKAAIPADVNNTRELFRSTSSTIYEYRRADGTKGFADHRAAIPKSVRASARLVDALSAKPSALPEADVKGVEKVTNAVTDVVEKAKSLKPTLPLEDKVSSLYQQMKASTFCDLAKEYSALSFAADLWSQFAPLVVAAAIFLLFVFVTPVFFRSGFGAAWLRVLLVALPLLAFVGLMGFASYRTMVIRDAIAGVHRSCTDTSAKSLEDKQESVTVMKDRVMRWHRLRDERIASLFADPEPEFKAKK